MKMAAKAAAILVAALCTVGAYGAECTNIPARKPIDLADGINDVHVGTDTLKVVKAFVNVGTAHSYDTYTTFVAPNHPGDQWLHVRVRQPDSDVADFRSFESADSNVQAIALYCERGSLFVVQAEKIGANPPDLYLKPARVEFTTYRYHGESDFVRFDQDKKFQSTQPFLNASDGLVKEFFKK
ncbi:hypothetical protein [Trinickia fusca]|uniref:Uncharacterized protein n=1 Tax=Trinickia fusca TaxID=2419777 RepID=A0A494X4A7_9BURK|nr:hypothetical protein [Trinickia fusca]RKP45180.1 hypothetical protein D7S89_20315 [Trinickia fusca]